MQVRLGKALHPPWLLVQSRGGCCCRTALPWRLLVPDCHPQICWRIGERVWVLRKVVRWIKQGMQFNYHQSQEVHTELESCFISIWLTPAIREMSRDWTIAVSFYRMPDLKVGTRTCQREIFTWTKSNTRSIGFISWTPMSGPCRRKFSSDTSIRWAYLLFLPNTCISELPNINIILRC